MKVKKGTERIFSRKFLFIFGTRYARKAAAAQLRPDSEINVIKPPF